MQRVCFVLQVRPERLEEYRSRHREVWPEMRQALQDTGWKNYSLFLRSDGMLVGYLETEDFERDPSGNSRAGRECPLAEENGGFFVSPKGDLPDRAMSPLEEVFHLD